MKWVQHESEHPVRDKIYLCLMEEPDVRHHVRLVFLYELGTTVQPPV